MAYHSAFSDEEVELDRIDILEMLKQGIPYRIICDDLGRPKSYVERIKKELIERKIITEKELEDARKEYRRNHPTAQGIEKTKVYKQKDLSRQLQKKQKKIKNKEKILQLFKEGYTQAEIARKMNLTDSAINLYKKELISEGKLKKENIKKVTNNTSFSKIDKYRHLIPEVIELMKKGLSTHEIREKMKISPSAYEAISQYIRRNNLISKEEKEKVENQKYKDELERVEQFIKKGCSLKKVHEENQDISRRKLKKIVDLLIENGSISRELVEENKKKEAANTKNAGRIMSPEEQRSFVLKNIRKGLSPTEILKEDSTNSLTLNKIEYIKKELIKNGKISKKKATNELKKHKNKKIKSIHNIRMISIKKFIEMGWSKKEIAEYLEISQQNLSEIIKEYTKNNEWYSDEEIRQFKKEKKQKEQEQEKKIKEWIEKRKANKDNLNSKKSVTLEEFDRLKKAAYLAHDEYIAGNKKKIKIIKEYLEYLISMREDNLEPDEAGVKIAGNIIAECDEIKDKKYIKYIILQYNKIFGEEVTIRYINRLIREFEDKELSPKLEIIKQKIREMNLKKEIIKRINDGEKASDIARNLNISFTEVNRLLKKDIKIEIDER